MLDTLIRIREEGPETRTQEQRRMSPPTPRIATGIEESTKLVVCTGQVNPGNPQRALKKVFVYLMPTDCEVPGNIERLDSYIFDGLSLTDLKAHANPSLNRLGPYREEELAEGVSMFIFQYFKRNHIYKECEHEAKNLRASISFNN